MQIFFKPLVVLIFAWNISVCAAQKKNEGKLPYIIEGFDTIPVINLPEVSVTEDSPDYLKKLREYYRLRFNVLKVYPYAQLASVKIKIHEEQWKLLKSNREKKKFTKEFEEQLRSDFEKQIENLSVNQGKIFIKLLDRECGKTGFEIIKDYKGSFSAFFLQTSARLFGHNLKTGYDPEGDDKTIEAIIRQIETGQIK